MKNLIKIEEEVFIISNTKSNSTFNGEVRNIFIPIVNSNMLHNSYFYKYCSLPRSHYDNILLRKHFSKQSISNNDFSNVFNILDYSYRTQNISAMLYSKINKILNINVKQIINNDISTDNEKFLLFIESYDFNNILKDNDNNIGIKRYVSNLGLMINNHFFENINHVSNLYNSKQNNSKVNILLKLLITVITDKTYKSFAKITNPEYLFFLLNRRVGVLNNENYKKNSELYCYLDFLDNKIDIMNLKKLKKQLYSFFDLEDNLKLYFMGSKVSNEIIYNHIIFYIILKYDDFQKKYYYNPPVEMKINKDICYKVINFSLFFKRNKLDILFKNMLKFKDIKLLITSSCIYSLYVINNKLINSNDTPLPIGICLNTGQVTYN